MKHLSIVILLSLIIVGLMVGPSLAGPSKNPWQTRTRSGGGSGTRGNHGTGMSDQPREQEPEKRRSTGTSDQDSDSDTGLTQLKYLKTDDANESGESAQVSRAQIEPAPGQPEDSGESIPPEPEQEKEIEDLSEEDVDLEAEPFHVFPNHMRGVCTADECIKKLKKEKISTTGIDWTKTWNYMASVKRFLEWYDGEVKDVPREPFEYPYEFAMAEPKEIYEKDFTLAEAQDFPNVSTHRIDITIVFNDIQPIYFLCPI